MKFSSFTPSYVVSCHNFFLEKMANLSLKTWYLISGIYMSLYLFALVWSNLCQNSTRLCGVQVKRTGTGNRGQEDLYYYKRIGTGLWNWLEPVGKRKEGVIGLKLCLCAEIPLKRIGKVRWESWLHVEKSGGEFAKGFRIS